MSRLLADNHRSALGCEAADKADFLLLSAGGVPRNPEAVGMACLRFTVMLRKLFAREDVFAVRLWIGGVAIAFVERIYNQRPVDLNRIAIRPFEEYQATAETPHRSAVLMQHCIAPASNDLAWWL